VDVPSEPAQDHRGEGERRRRDRPRSTTRSPASSCSSLTATPKKAAHDDQVDAASQYLVETYLTGGEASIIVPIGRIPLSSVKRQGLQVLAPFQRRINDRYLRR
jgi:hypothetical protein